MSSRTWNFITEGSKPHGYSGYPVVKKKLISMGIEGIFFLTFGFKDEI
jgi:hypothetical protein